MPYDAGPPERKGIHKRLLPKDVSRIRARCDAAFLGQKVFLELWQTQADLFYPERADFTVERSDAQDRFAGLYTSESILLCRDMATQIGSMLRPRGTDWFKLTTRPEDVVQRDHEARAWCERATVVQRNMVYWARAQFAKTMAESDRDYVTIGNSLVWHTYNSDMSGLLFRCEHMRNVAWRENEEGAVDQFYIRKSYPLRVVASMFGKENLPKHLQQDCNDDTKLDRDIAILIAVEPVRMLSDEVVPDGAMFRAAYILQTPEQSDDQVLAVGYYRASPCTARRWMTVSGEDYGRSPCAGVALADAAVLNAVQRSLLKGVEFSVDPPKLVRDASIISDINLRAGEYTYYDDDFGATGNGQARFKPIENVEAGETRIGMEFKERLTETMRAAFYENYLKLPDTRQMTAYEVDKRIEIYTRTAAPVFEPMEAENSNMMEACFLRGFDQGAFGRKMPDGSVEGLPESLSEVDVEWEFQTPLTRALRQQKSSQFDQLVAQAVNAAQIAPEVIDNIDFDEAFRQASEGLAPSTWLKRPEVVQQIREQRAAQQQQAEQEAQMMQAADMATRLSPEQVATLKAEAQGMTE